ncbi:CTD nuclear envelope phosphatase 1-like [Selaginella moellendorffii]|uniref:CTD nuclear envelope phosphatase 1-like n=1 Tax=Selaginella moellendorffii TaxID=88036 RepID=UPI000D1C5823|nr:CTD nuclear envelope phosphatase 1-like [Selaginella moellendorffii]|eukprot:XP_024535990.1 CTD nuclear envelope phosphatase 1-like [Selaginella moellendorffii]
MARVKPTMVLDLDNTLVYAHTDMVAGSDFTMERAGEESPLFIMKRPGVDAFLKRISKVFRLVVFSAGVEEYVNFVVDHLDPAKTMIWKKLHSGHCKIDEGTKFKDLGFADREFRGVDLKRLVALDDLVDFYPKEYRENVVRAEKFEGSPGDCFLQGLAPFLLALAKLPDFRRAIVCYNNGECKEMNGRVYIKDAFDDSWVDAFL